MRRLLLLACITLVVAACACAAQERGTLTGHVTIGPLQPVQREGEPAPTPSPEVYAAWKIMVYTLDMRKEVARAAIDDEGRYAVELHPGTYTVMAEQATGGGFAQQTHTVGIAAGQTTQQDIDIDTGIR
jgi:uncharacterized protein (DUF2141 family)